jgi:hypothetical protein
MVRRIIVRSSDSPRSLWGTIGAVAGVLLSAVYLLNLSLGLLEIPDNLPIIGNLDEVVVSAFFYGCLRRLGINLIPFQRKEKHPVEQVGR